MPETRWIYNVIDDVTLIYMRIEKSVMITTTEPDSSRMDHCQRQALIVVPYETKKQTGRGGIPQLYDCITGLVRRAGNYIARDNYTNVS